MNTENNGVKTSKRFIAFLLDVLLLFFLIGLITSIRFINPQYEKYLESYEKYSDVLERYYNNEINESEMVNLNKENYYNVTKFSISYNIVIVVVILAYFVLFQKYNNGQTIGKKIMKIKVIGKENNNPTLGAYLLRTLFIYYIYIGSIIPLIVNLILVFILNPTYYMIVSSIINYSFLILSIIIFTTIIVRKDKRGIHELISKTKVIGV